MSLDLLVTPDEIPEYAQDLNVSDDETVVINENNNVDNNIELDEEQHYPTWYLLNRNLYTASRSAIRIGEQTLYSDDNYAINMSRLTSRHYLTNQELASVEEPTSISDTVTNVIRRIIINRDHNEFKNIKLIQTIDDEDKEEQECVICFENKQTNKFVEYNCKHKCCIECSIKSTCKSISNDCKPNCHLCRRNISEMTLNIDEYTNAVNKFM